MELILVILFLASIIAYISHYSHKKRREALLIKYQDDNIVRMILEKIFWQGQTAEQLIDSIGEPIDRDIKVLKSKTKEIWKYNRTGKGRFALRITLENSLVVGWEQKS